MLQGPTEQTYDAMAARWVADDDQQTLFWQDEFDTFTTTLPSGHILEIGAGGGRDGEEFVRRGYHYTGIDSSAGMIAAAKRLHPTLHLLQQDVCALTFSNKEKFDGFWAAAVLLHLPKSKIGKALDNIRSVMRQHAPGMVIMREGEGEGLRERIKHGIKDQRYFAYYTETEFAQLLKEHGFMIEATKQHTGGDEYNWLAFLVRVE